MRILYVATDQIVPGTLGGSVHVQAVASPCEPAPTITTS
jgi:hypothetical protein